ncbi:MAG: ribosome maturation factor RimP [Gemmatimonadota bacterium]|jgi:ribosome maturation factor RimP
MSDDALIRSIEERVERLGFEFVELERAGSRSRPVLRIRMDRPGSTPGHGVTIEDCRRVSRELESLLDADDRFSERYVLEVSSPGIERPLVRPRDFRRFAGRPVAVVGHETLVGRARRLEGELLGIEETDTDETVTLRLDDGSEVGISRREIARAHLIFRWPGQ